MTCPWLGKAGNLLQDQENKPSLDSLGLVSTRNVGKQHKIAARQEHSLQVDPSVFTAFKEQILTPPWIYPFPHKHRETHFSVLSTITCCHFLNWEVLMAREGCGDSRGINKKAKCKVSLWFQQKASPWRCFGLQSALKQLTCISKMGELPPTQHTQGHVYPL